ncbi:MAG: hypothetical protein K9L32_02325 [Chromatiaceae bacterium]|nr:hypothetical protein [Chromatiaceae bacterium]
MIENLIKKRLAMRSPWDASLITASDIGVALISAIEGLPVVNADLTAQWEQRLSALQDGAPPQTFDRDIDAFVRDLTQQLLVAPVDAVDEVRSLGDCPRCGAPVVANAIKFACDESADPSCGFVVWRWRGGKRVGRAEALQRMRENNPHESHGSPEILPPQSPHSESQLPPYVTWSPRPLKSLDDVQAVVMEIVRVEQPVVVRRITRLIDGSSKAKRKAIKSAVNRATMALVRDGKLVEDLEIDEPGQQPKVVHLPESEPVVLRQRGPRDIDEIPVRELMALMQEGGEIVPRVLQELDLPDGDIRVVQRLMTASVLSVTEAVAEIGNLG